MDFFADVPSWVKWLLVLFFTMGLTHYWAYEQGKSRPGLMIPRRVTEGIVKECVAFELHWVNNLPGAAVVYAYLPPNVTSCTFDTNAEQEG